MTNEDRWAGVIIAFLVGISLVWNIFLHHELTKVKRELEEFHLIEEYFEIP